MSTPSARLQPGSSSSSNLNSYYQHHHRHNSYSYADGGASTGRRHHPPRHHGHTTAAAAAVVAPIPRHQQHQQPTATISVGGDDWANQVINNVVGNSEYPQHHSPPTDVVQQHEEVNAASSAAVKEKIAEKKRKFHADRTLELKNLPDGATEQDIRLALPDVDIIRVEIDRMDVRHRPGAKLYLKHPHTLDAWPQHRDIVYVRNKEVNLCLGTSDKWLCVARLPFTYTEDQLTTMMAAYGRIKHAFLVCSEVTGESKGYGLVKYESQEAAAQAKQFLNGKIMESEAIQVDWLNSSYIQYSQLHSKCLYVSNLPPNFRDLPLFRKIFSVVKNPPYCQIAMKNGVLQDWGLVEFFDHVDAEKTQQEIDGYLLHGSNIRVLYCIPGVNAINIYMSLVTAPDTVSRKGLVDEVPSSTVYAQLQKLGTQNPAFAQNLQGIIQNHIESIQSSSSERLPDNPHDQAALMILLAAQHQAEKDEPSLLQNQEVVDVLQNLVCGRDNNGEGGDPYSQLLRIPSLQVALGQQQGNADTTAQHAVATSAGQLSPNSPPPVIANNLNLLTNTQTLNEMLGSLKARRSSGHSEDDNILAAPAVTNTAAAGANQPLLGTAPPDFSRPPPNIAVQALHPPPPPPPPVASASAKSSHFLTPPPPLPVVSSPSLSLAASPVPMLNPAGLIQQQPPTQAQVSLAQQLIASPALLSSPPPTAPQQIPLTSPYLGIPPTFQPLPGLYVPPGLEGLLTPPLPAQAIVPAQPLLFNPLTGGVLPSSVMPPTVGQIATAGLIPSTATTIGVQPPLPPTSLPPPQSLPQPTMARGAVTSPGPVGSRFGVVGGGVHTASAPHPNIMVAGTPNPAKRKASIPPSPEDSPDGRRYIGQHSQGLGGHYADSYWSKKRAKYS